MRKRAISLVLVVSMSYTLLYPELSLNDNVVQYEEEEALEDETEISLMELLRAPKSQKKYKLRLWEWLSEVCR